jgi:hypothetical protein
MVEAPPELKAELRKQRIVRGGPSCVIHGDAEPQGRDRQQIWDVRDRAGVPRDQAYKGVGFRCARSAAARFPRNPGK